MRYRWSYSEDGGTVWTEVSPTNGSRLSITQARDLSAGQVFFRKKLAQAVILGSTDYRAIDAIRRNPARRCETLLLRCEAMCGSWSEYWRGEFSAGSAKWDLDNCTVEIKAETVDRYSCLLKRKDDKANVLQAALVDAEALILPSLEFGICVTIGLTEVPPTGCDEFYAGGNITNPLINEWESGHAQAEDANGDTYQLNIFWRERLTTECMNDTPVPPAGSGWVLLANDCATSGTAVYVRNSTIAWGFGDAVRGSFVNGVPTPPDGACLYQYIGSFDEALVDPFDDTLGEVPFFICLTAATPIQFNRARTLESIIAFVLDKTGCGIDTVVSDFFEWSPPGDAPGYVAGQNYVTGQVNDYDQIVLLQKSDAIDPAASNPATIGELTFQELADLMRVAFRCLWDITEAGELRIEHWSYWTEQQGIDLREMGNVIEPLVFESVGDEIPRIERAAWMEAQGRDFVGKDIVYDSACAVGPAKEWSAGRFTTDISFIIADPDAIGKDGFCLLATRLVSGTYQTIVATGAITGNFVSNAPLSWANLEDTLWRHDRYLPSGTMNGAITDFNGFLPTVKQDGVAFDACCSTLGIDPREAVAGRLSDRLAALGLVESMTHDLYADRITMVLRYAY